MLLILATLAIARSHWYAVPGPVEQPPGVTITTKKANDEIIVGFTATGTEVATVDWNTVVFVLNDGSTNAAVPGTERISKLGGPYQPTTIVPGATATVYVFPAKYCDGHGCGRPLGRDELAGFSLDLGITVGGTTTRVRIPYTVVNDENKPACDVYHGGSCATK